jgi:hypothetical protein
MEADNNTQEEDFYMAWLRRQSSKIADPSKKPQSTKDTFQKKVLEQFKDYHPTVLELLLNKSAYRLRGAQEYSSWRLAAMRVFKNNQGNLPYDQIGRFFDEQEAKNPEYWREVGDIVADAFDSLDAHSNITVINPNSNNPTITEKETN